MPESPRPPRQRPATTRTWHAPQYPERQSCGNSIPFISATSSSKSPTFAVSCSPLIHTLQDFGITPPPNVTLEHVLCVESANGQTPRRALRFLFGSARRIDFRRPGGASPPAPTARPPSDPHISRRRDRLNIRLK